MAAVSLKVVADKAITEAGANQVLFSVQPPQDGDRQPCDLVCVIDVSGSMGTEATIQNESGQQESHGLSLLDVAKHGVKTIIETMGEGDRLSLVSFNTGSNTVFPLTKMDEAGRTAAKEKLDALQAGGGTNIWAGLQDGMEALRVADEEAKLAHVMLLTDGMTQNKDSVLPNLKAYKTEKEWLPATINTFGFGYSLDSPLLSEMAREGSGSYSFIPDAGFVGTAFVNTVSNLLATMAHEAYLVIDAEDVATIDCKVDDTTKLGLIDGGYELTQDGEYPRVFLGTLRYGQTKDVVLPLQVTNPDGKLFASVSYKVRGSKEQVEDKAEQELKAVGADAVAVNKHICRTTFVDALKTVVFDTAEVTAKKDVLDAAIAKVKSSPAVTNEDVVALLADMEGQSSEAVSKPEWYRKWGAHYLPSLMFAHRLQQCNNFKDPGVQVYGGALFKKMQDEADEIFNKLEAPKPSVRRYGGGYSSAPVNMAAYNNACGG